MTFLRSSRSPQATGRRFPGWLWWAYLGAALLYTVPPVVLYFFYRQPGFDLGIYDQTIWLLAHGESFNTVAGIHVFGAHFSPILYLLTPLAFIPGGAVPELVFEALFVATAVFPIRTLARELGQNEKALVLLGVIHPGVFSALWWGMRPWNLAYPIVLWAALAIVRRPHWATVTLFGVGGLAFREDIGLWVGLVAVILALAKKVEWRHVIIAGLPVAAASALVFTVLLPRWSPVGSYLYETAVVGGTDTTVIKQVASSSARVVFLLLPVMLLTQNFTRLRWTLAAPLAIPIVGLAQRAAGSLGFSFHYDLLLVAAVALVVALSPRVTLRPRLVIAGALLVGVAAGALNPLTRDIGGNPFGIRPTAAAVYGEVADRIEALDDGTSSLSVPKFLVPHFSEREQIFIFPYPFDMPYPEPYPMECPLPDIVVADPARPPTPTWNATRDADYELHDSVGDLRIYLLRPSARTSGDCRPPA